MPCADAQSLIARLGSIPPIKPVVQHADGDAGALMAFRTRDGTAASARTPVLPEAMLIGALSAQGGRRRAR